MYEPIAIIGYGVLYPPNSDNVQNFWKNIKNGVQGIREVTNEVWNVNDYYNEDENVPDKTYCKNSAYLDNTGSLMDYISKFNLDDGKILSLNRTKKMVLYTILQAIDEANLNINEFYQNGNTVVPTFISKTISLESFNIGEKVKAYVEKVAENGDEVIYDAFVFNESKLLLIIEQMHLTKVGQTSDYEIEI